MKDECSADHKSRRLASGRCLSDFRMLLKGLLDELMDFSIVNKNCQAIFTAARETRKRPYRLLSVGL